jgi:hypothetical protein
MAKRRKVLGDITNQAALPRRIRPSTTYGGCKAYNTTRSVHQEAVLESITTS